MNKQSEASMTTGHLRSVEEIMDTELKKEGWTQQQLEEGKLLMGRYERLLFQGYTDEQINTLWEGKTNQEILAEASEKKAAPRTSQRQIRKPTALNKTP